MTQDGDKPENSEDESALPEIEAEIVDESAATTDSAFDNDDDQDPIETDEAASAPKSTLTPGVILFLVFAFVALTAFGVWRWQMHSSGAKMAADPAASIVETPADLTTETAPEKPTDEAVADAPADSANDKIGNVDIGNMKRAPEQPAVDRAAGDSFLPPVSTSSTGKLSNSVEEGAKEAMRRFQEAETAADNKSPAQTPDENVPEQNSQSVSGFDIAPTPDLSAENQSPEQQTPPADSSPALGEHVESITTGPNNDMAEVSQTLKAEIARLNEALEAERSRTIAQTNEIETLRNELSTARSSRDAHVQEELSSMRALLEKARNADANATSRQAQGSMALSALKSAVDQGVPYRNELAALSSYAPNAGAALAAHAPEGVATESDLRERFGAAAKAAIIAARQEEAGGGFAGLVVRATSIVTFWPSEPTAGNEPGAIISRAENALERGDVGFALTQLDALPATAKTAMAAWLTEAGARAEVVAAISGLEAQLSARVEQ